MGLHDEAKLDQKFMEFAKLMNIYLNHFPKHEKFGLALEIRRAAYEVYGFIVEAQKRYHKKTALTSLDTRHEQLRMLIRLTHTLGYFEFKDGKRTHSLQALLHFTKENYNHDYHRLPQIYQHAYYPRSAFANGRGESAHRH